MSERRVAVAAPEGLHARPAAVFVRAAADSAVAVSVGRPDGPAVDARSILAVLSLDVRHGEEVVLRADGPDAEATLGRLAALLAGETVHLGTSGETDE
jgi:phosphocarrier protein HPr